MPIPFPQNSHREGLYLSCINGQHIIIDDYGPCIMTAEDDNINFGSLTTGGRIRIEVMLIEETYPMRARIYDAKKRNDGDPTDINADLLTDLAEMSWIEANSESITVPDYCIDYKISNARINLRFGRSVCQKTIIRVPKPSA